MHTLVAFSDHERCTRWYPVRIWLLEARLGYQRYHSSVSVWLSAVLCPYAIPVRPGTKQALKQMRAITLSAPTQLPLTVVSVRVALYLCVCPLQVVKFVIALYLGMTPFAIVDTLGWLTPAGIFVLSLLFLAVDEIGAEIEDPFGACTSARASAADQVVDCAHRACVLLVSPRVR
eukprot:COSAG02_NODE_9179_length_2300_cov_2.226261_3_plen_175_part_00